VIARTIAVARATRPAISAISEPMGVPPLCSADTLATGLSFPAWEPGATLGNRPAALPPGLAVGVGNAKPDAAMVGSGDELAGVGVPGARTTTEADAAGARVRLAALPVTVRLTALMAVAVSGTLTCAWKSRWAEPASSAPRSHADVPLPVAQPKVKVGAPAPAVEVSWILASGRLPPCAQAPTSHWAVCPRSLLCCKGTTPTHRLTGEAVAAGVVAVAAGDDVEVVGADVVGAEVVGAEVVGVGVGVEVLGVGVGVGVVSVGVGVGVGVGVCVVGVGVGVGVPESVSVGVGVPESVGVGVSSAGAWNAVRTMPWPETLAPVALVVAAVEAVAVGDALTAFSGSQDSLSPGVVAAVALLVMAATTPPVAAVSRALPAIKVTALRRPCAIRILTHIDQCHCEINHLP
jgi:hypothetical protein